MSTVWRLAGLFLALSVLSVVLFDAAVATWGREKSYEISVWSNGEISAEGHGSIATIARAMAKDGEYRAVLKGFAPAGADELAAKRAAAVATRAVREALIARGIPEGRLTLLSPEAYKAAAGTGDGAKGRRVTVVISK